MHNRENIFIVGSFGVGKTTIGRALAKKLHMRFYDTDLLVEERSGVDLAWIFDKEGEEGFQKREKVVLKELIGYSNSVIATGGSIALYSQNFNLLPRENAQIVHLSTMIEYQINRILRNSRHRPLLKIKTLANLRKACVPMYEEIAHIQISTHNKSIKMILKEILSQLER